MKELKDFGLPRRNHVYLSKKSNYVMAAVLTELRERRDFRLINGQEPGEIPTVGCIIRKVFEKLGDDPSLLIESFKLENFKEYFALAKEQADDYIGKQR